jgi:hypothetical protein
LNEWDFIGVRDLSAHEDEYDCLLGPLLTRLAGGAGVGDVRSYLRQMVQDHFGLDPGQVDVDGFAERAVAWWARTTADSS